MLITLSSNPVSGQGAQSGGSEVVSGFESRHWGSGFLQLPGSQGLLSRREKLKAGRKRRLPSYCYHYYPARALRPESSY